MIFFSFCLAYTALLLQGILIPKLSLLAFAPFLGIVLIRSPFFHALCLSALAGCMVDLLSDDPMGLHALNYVLCAALLFRIRKNFSHEQPFHLSLLTGLISSLSTLLQLLLLFLFDRRVPFGGKWIFADLIGMPVIDALYAFVWFAAPLALFELLRRNWMVFWLKKKNRSPVSH